MKKARAFSVFIFLGGTVCGENVLKQFPLQYWSIADLRVLRLTHPLPKLDFLEH